MTDKSASFDRGKGVAKVVIILWVGGYVVDDSFCHFQRYLVVRHCGEMIKYNF